jgi:hypothetical protein
MHMVSSSPPICAILRVPYWQVVFWQQPRALSCHHPLGQTLPLDALRRRCAIAIPTQVVHHLFPGINHVHYPALAPIVLKTCAEFGVPYKVYPTFWAALGAHFKHLRDMGAGSVLAKLPSLATVG